MPEKQTRTPRIVFFRLLSRDLRMLIAIMRYEATAAMRCITETYEQLTIHRPRTRTKDRVFKIGKQAIKQQLQDQMNELDKLKKMMKAMSRIRLSQRTFSRTLKRRRSVSEDTERTEVDEQKTVEQEQRHDVRKCIAIDSNQCTKGRWFQRNIYQ